MKQAYALKVAAVVQQGCDAVLVRFAPEDSHSLHFRFQPGQYLTIEAGPEDNRQWRCYSIASDPSDNEIGVLVRRVAGGLVSNWVCDQVRAGDTLRVFPPAGGFTLRHPGEPLLLFAGGSGIAPIVSLARQALTCGARRVMMFYANRNRATAMLMDEIAALQDRFPEQLQLKFWYDEIDGLPSEADITGMALDMNSCDAYLCGPEPFMRLVRQSLGNAGLDPSQVFCEEFTAADADTSGSQDAAVVSSMQVTLKGQVHQVPVRDKETLLAAMMNASLPVPHACKVGECASCMCRLESGSIERLSNSVLDEDDEASGWLLACRSLAAGASVSVRFP